MKCLKIVLVSVYIILIVLLLLLRCCETPNGELNEYEKPLPPIMPDDPIERAETIGNKGKLKVTLLWNFPADLDLHILEPNNTEIYYENKSDAETGGFLDVDNIKGGNGAAENIFWENPPEGEYVVSVKYYKAIDDVPRQGYCQVVIFKGEESPVTYNIEMSEVGKKIQVTRIRI